MEPHLLQLDELELQLPVEVGDRELRTDLAEVRTVTVDPGVQGKGVGHLLLDRLVEHARWLGIARVFVLTFEVDFFQRHGFREIGGAPVSHEVYEELLRSFDEGVAEFLDLERVKPNTLGNTRMLLEL